MHKESQIYCSSEFSDPYTPNNKIHQHYPNAENIEVLFLWLGHSNHILAGINETFSKVKSFIVISAYGTSIFVDNNNLKNMKTLEELVFFSYYY